MIISPVKCCLSGQELSENDNAVYFPIFLDVPSLKDYKNPIVLCNEAVALRSALFESEVRDILIEKSRKSWIYRARNDNQIVFENDNCLIRGFQLGDDLAVYFFEHIFSLKLPQAYWIMICDQLQKALTEIEVKFGSIAIKIKKDETKVVLCKKSDSLPYELISISHFDWDIVYKSIEARLRNN